MSAATARADTAATDNHDAGVSPVTVLVEKLSARPVTGDTFLMEKIKCQNFLFYKVKPS